MTRITSFDLIHLRMPLVEPFTTSFGRIEEKDLVIVKATSTDGISGYGESAILNAPTYNEETIDTCLLMQQKHIIPPLLIGDITSVDDVVASFSWIRRNAFAKAGVEMAIHDLLAKTAGVSLAAYLGGTRETIASGISVGLKTSSEELVDFVTGKIEEGYQRIKLKIKPGKDHDLVEAVRRRHPDIPLMVDANSAYRLENIAQLQALDPHHLLMIEQPLGHDDIVDHAIARANLKTPLCLDESIHSVDDVRRAIYVGSVDIINIKPGRLGGLSAAKAVHDYCQAKGIPVWCGGMLESGIGRAHNIALATLPNFTLPGDIAASNNYYTEDIVEPDIRLLRDGTIRVPTGPGIGYAVNEEKMKQYTVSRMTIRR